MLGRIQKEKKKAAQLLEVLFSSDAGKIPQASMEINIAEGNPNSWHSFDATATLGNATTTNITKVNTIQLEIVALCWQDLQRLLMGLGLLPPPWSWSCPGPPDPSTLKNAFLLLKTS